MYRSLQHPVALTSSMSTEPLHLQCVHVCACVSTLIPHGVAELGEEGQQLRLQANRCKAEGLEQGLGLHAVLMVLHPKTTRTYLQP